MEMFAPNDVLNILRKHHLPMLKPEKGEFEGVVNEIWFSGDLAIRINKNLNYESDGWTETVAVHALTAQGIRTPRLVAFDSDLDVVPRLVTIYERVSGKSLSQTPNLPDPASFFRELGAAIREFHDKVDHVDDPHNRLDPQWNTNPQATFQAFELLEPRSKGIFNNIPMKTSEEPNVFGHQDLHADNILVHNGKLSAIIDWGDAAWCCRAVDLRYIPARFLPAACEGYGPLSISDTVDLIRHQVEQFVYA